MACLKLILNRTSQLLLFVFIVFFTVLPPSNADSSTSFFTDGTTKPTTTMNPFWPNCSIVGRNATVDGKCASWHVYIAYAMDATTLDSEFDDLMRFTQDIWASCAYVPLDNETREHFAPNTFTFLGVNRQFSCEADKCDFAARVEFDDVIYAPKDGNVDLATLIRRVINNATVETQGSAFYVFSNIPCDNANFFSNLTWALNNQEVFAGNLSGATDGNYRYFIYRFLYLNADAASGNSACIFKILEEKTGQLFQQVSIEGLSNPMPYSKAMNDLYLCPFSGNYPPPKPSDSKKDNGNGARVALIIAISIPGGILILLALCILFCVFRRRTIIKFLNQQGLRTAHSAYRRHFRELCDEWEINPENLFILDEKLGSGAFATVYKGNFKGRLPILDIYSTAQLALDFADPNSNDVAVKVLPPHADETNKADFLQEIDFMKQLGYHPHILCLLGCVTDPEQPILVIEFCHNGDLLHMLRASKEQLLAGKEEEGQTLNMKDLVSFAWQISDALIYLSSRHYIHRDVAARNVLVTKMRVAKLSDFGLCRYSDQAHYTTKGGILPIKWMAFESLQHFEYTTKSDVWSYGVMLYELFSMGDTPYMTVQPSEMVDYLKSGKRLEQPESCPDNIYQLMFSCWAILQDERPNFEQIKEKLASILSENADNYGYVSFSEEYKSMYAETKEKIQEIEEEERRQSRAASLLEQLGFNERRESGSNPRVPVVTFDDVNLEKHRAQAEDASRLVSGTHEV